ncbi:hypothetical protein LAG90_14845 [Marinilongibacter aquaticus]|uniref:hypothetical protein n=1 Tax=Marinilongibacter aquaticus TaxID=2975157 RepID=UPI0021BD680C|nr:hypothetical protein [Marinilongibacter aquaticus]UBM58082.1 hypothetical protein LAG90_14845 [Marinilongibacter aquaticus]
MKKTAIFRSLGITLVFAMLTFTACKKDKVDEPIDYNFDDEFKDVDVADITETEPEAVTSTEGDLEDSAEETAADEALANGEVTPEVANATATISASVSEEDAQSLSEGFTPDVVSALAAGGTLDAALQAQIDAIASTGALDGFLPTLVAPTVDGAAVSARKAAGGTESTEIANFRDMLLGISDECTDKAQEAFDAAKSNLDTKKAGLVAKIDATLATRQASYQTEYDDAVAAATTKWQTKRDNATAALNTAIAGVDAALASGDLDAAGALFTKIFLYAKYAKKLDRIATGETADKNAAQLKKDKRDEKAQTAYDTDLAQINSNYNTALSTAQGILSTAQNSCHNQGSSL